ncbi:MAG: hypothetical protein WC289_06130 [Patescibacteria group bacterium]|jgi:hypothetical protein
MSETLALFRIIDPQYAKKILEKMPDYRHVYQRVESWKKKHSEYWNEIERRLDFCDSVGLGTTIGADEPDVRWELFLRHGPFFQERVSQMYTLSDAICSVWIYTWPDEVEFSCQGKPDGSYPVRIMEPDKEGFLNAKIIWPSINSSEFPVNDSTFDVWIAVWVKGNELTRPTLDGGILTVQVTLCDTMRHPLRTSSVAPKLQMVRALLEAVDRDSRKFVRAMAYIQFTGVKIGRYTAHIAVAGASANGGDAWTDIDLVYQRRISDLLLLHPVVREDSLKGIVRGNTYGLYDNPEAMFRSDDSLHLYAEALISTPGSYDAEYTVMRIPEITRRSNRGVVTIGEPVVSGDSLGRPFKEGIWSVPNPEFLEALTKQIHHDKVITLFKRQYQVSGDTLHIVDALRLQQNLKTGMYLLTLKISDLVGHGFFLTTRRLIYLVHTIK